jgi:hypothetical protein
VPKKTEKPKEEEKGWPRSVILTGYAVAGIFIPYSIGWFLSMHANARRMAAKVIPGLETILRSHFGHEEYTPYQDLKDGTVPEKKLDDEDPFDLRRQQELIEALIQEETPVHIHISKDGGTVSKFSKFPGTTLATASRVAPEASDGEVALDFDDLPAEDDGPSEQSSYLTVSPETLTDQVYSMWYFQPPQEPQDRQKLQQSTEHDIEISRLEYTIKNLEMELKDINSTRDIDEMQEELSKCRSELRNLRWKRRLGMS